MPFTLQGPPEMDNASSSQKNLINDKRASSNKYIELARTYELPAAVKLKLDADVQQAQAIAIVITLLAGAIITLTSILGGIDSMEEQGSSGWKVFRILMWIGIICDVGEAFVCIFAIKMCTELPVLALELEMELLDENEGGALERAERDAHYGPRLVTDRYLLLESVGMSRFYRVVDRLVIGLLVVASVFSFVTLFYWVLHTQTIVVAGVILVAFVIVVAIVLAVFAISMGLGRKRSKRSV
ncbi:hypothetical protein M408DRAFT_331784 [Serendipita vermifera MAFF 305830]|uniref:Transmembrane protein n=1 Tax=Serendipita vermifera MAFF 305830 TaxID=933852 RepID=A0A0C3AWQ0_SERVB|nr:hypothetical protein M408DRAFT_331784 [Serendipita vermifera MAFF 305830]